MKTADSDCSQCHQRSDSHDMAQFTSNDGEVCNIFGMTMDAMTDREPRDEQEIESATMNGEKPSGMTRQKKASVGETL